MNTKRFNLKVNAAEQELIKYFVYNVNEVLKEKEIKETTIVIHLIKFMASIAPETLNKLPYISKEKISKRYNIIFSEKENKQFSEYIKDYPVNTIYRKFLSHVLKDIEFKDILLQALIGHYKKIYKIK